MEENSLFKQHIKLELCDDLPECSTTTTSKLFSSLPENQLEQNDASLRENGEICVIVKEDPEIFDAAEFFASKNAFDQNVTNDSDVSEDYEDDTDDDVDYYPDNYKKAKWDSNDLDEETDDNVGDSLENHGNQKKLKTRSEKEKILYAKYTILNYYYIILCPYCGIEIKNGRPWRKHMKSKHNFDNSLRQYYTFVDEFHKECNECKVVLKNSIKLLKPHTMSHLPLTNIFKCKICSKLHAHAKDMRSHIDTEHIELVSSVLGRGFDVKCRKDSNCNTYGNAANNLQKTESKKITDIYKNQLTKQKNIQQTKDIRSKYMIRLCPFCGKECGSLKKNWLEHLNANHDFMNNIKESFTFLKNLGKQCKECEVVLKARNQALITHKIAHLPYKQIYKCKICAELRTWAAGLQSHIKRDHLDIVCKKLPSHVENMKGKYCVYCKKNIGCNERFLVHLKKEHDEIYKNKIVLVCPECGVKFSKEGAFRLHIKTDHKFDTLQGLSFEEVVGNMNDEEHRQENEMRYRCLKCNMLFGSCKMGILLTHAITHSPHKNYKCRYCNYSDSSKQKVLIHTCQALLVAFKGVPEEDHPRYSKNIYKPLGRMNRVDRTNKLYVCPSCGEEFHTAILHAQHLKVAHEFENFESLNISVFVDDMQQEGTNLKYSCNVCNQGFKVSSIRNFRVHAFKHMPFKRYKCALCQTASNRLSLCPCKDSDTMNGIAFICPHCNVENFKNEKEWFAHIQEIHADFVTPESLNFDQIHKEDKEQLIYKCNNCGKIINQFQLNNMLLHAFEHMSKKCFKCIMCGRSYDRKSDAIRNVYSCVKRKLTFNKCRDDETPFTKNWRTCSKFAKCQCPVCGFRLENNEDNELVGHLKQAHDFDLESVEHLNFIKCTDSATSEDVQTNYKCSECNQIIIDFSIMKLQEHKLAHLPYRMWHCSFCEYEFNSKAQVLYHIINWHLKERNLGKLLHFVCPACNERFDLNTEWRSHLNAKHEFNTLTGVRLEQMGNALKCIDCKCTVRDDRKLSHRFRHLPYRPYKCRFCRLTFHTKGIAKTHAKACRKNNEKTKKLGSTKKGTKRRDVVNRNRNIVQVHKTKRIVKFKKKIYPRDEYFAYACPECNIPLPNEDLWYVHINEQHGSFNDNLKIKEMPGMKVMCLECNKQIDDSPARRERHRLQHLPYRAFICNICRQRAKSKATLRIHFSRKHFSEVELKCNICLQVCKTHCEFSTHMKKQHTNIAMWPANLCPICVDFLPDGINVDFHIKINHLRDDIEAFEKETEIKLFLDEQAGLVINNKAALPANDSPTEMILPDMILSDSPEISNVAAPLFITSMATCSSKSTSLNKFYPYMGYACPECNIALPTQKDWHTHITTRHDFFAEHSLNITDETGESSRSICLECGTKIFGGVLHKQRHKLTHMPYRSFICKICLHRSKNQNGLCDHIKRKHFTPGEYKCEMCLVIFNTAVERYTHAKTEHTDIEWPANVCRICVSTVNRRDMSTHVKIHDYDREQFPCAYCTKYYLSNPERVRHLKAGHPLEYEKEQLEKKSENRISRNTEDFGMSLESNIKIELENCDELTGYDYTLEHNVDKTKQKKLRKLSKDEVPKRKRGRPRKMTESIPECCTNDDYKPGINESIDAIKRKRGRPRKIEKDQINDYKPGINELVVTVKRKRGRPPKIAKDQITMKSVEELDYALSLPVKEEFHRLDSESE